MLEGIQALLSVEKLGTVSEAAVELRLTQSAVSKRIQALEREMGFALLEKDGRRIRLTRAAYDLLLKAKPLMAQIEGLKHHKTTVENRVFSIGVADSLDSSWAPSMLRKALKKIPELKLKVHVHRSTLILENIKLGRYDLGLITGNDPSGGLVSIPVCMEEMILVGKRESGDKSQLLTIEAASATWKEIGGQVKNHPSLTARTIEFVESFAAATQMAREGFGQALVPIGVAESLGFSSADIHPLTPKLRRKIQLVTRKSMFDSAEIAKLSKILPELVPF